MTIDFYIAKASPPCRTVWMVLKQLNIDFNMKPINKPEDLKSEAYLKVNPRGRMPTLVDDGKVLTESRAIALYLINKYGGDAGEKLYPKDPLKRAKVDEVLFWDASVLAGRTVAWMRPQLFMGQGPDAEKGAELGKAFKELDDMLSDGRKFVALADQMTVADLSVLTMATFVWVKDFDMTPYPKVNEWVERMKNELPFYNETFEASIAWKKSMTGS